MRSQVQVLAGPPPIIAGQSTAGSEPGTLAASLGRAGAARPSPPASPSAPPGSSTQAAGATTTTHRGRPHPEDGNLALRPPPMPTAAPPATGAPQAGLACPGGQRQARPPPTPDPPRSATDSPAGHALPRRRRPRPGLLGRRPEPLDDVAAHRDLGSFPWCGCRAASACAQPLPLRPDGRVRTDGGGHQRAGHWMGGHQTAGRRLPDDEPR
jgi:hypothetical protein